MTTTHEMDCSDAAKMLIERMQTHPEDFNYGGKLYRALDAERLSVRDMKAYNDAHDRYIKEPALMVTVLQALLVQPEDEKREVIERAYQAGLGRANRVGMGATDPRMLHGKVIPYDPAKFDPYTDSHVLTDQQRITREMYENHIQTHKEALKKQPPVMHAKNAMYAEKESIAAKIYNKAFGRERVERDN